MAREAKWAAEPQAHVGVEQLNIDEGLKLDVHTEHLPGQARPVSDVQKFSSP